MGDYYISVKLKEQVISRAKGRCEYCKCLQKFSPQPFVMEHILPRSLGGETLFNNLALACGGCNGHKYNKTKALDPITGSITQLFDPRSNSWMDHFEWGASFVHIVGVTPTGRSTVRALCLNREELINLRKVMLLVSEHPPS